MRKNKNYRFQSPKETENNSAFQKLLCRLFSVKGIHNFDIFQYCNTYQVKLPIIYANIRV
ncbi:hypothetical protein [Flavobacterium kingsejongi]|uniref:Uncharacterized protein n=1 Tax=Flavobacterium kingsejongi TaxID=1678728 RepID=A0A2S1LTG4_9FLAO|nr:hypothetical protein [Flavobacterium kingsejongi]AWG26951.1 hypothetical protein FK004_17790 [Flavobacterium kingsejongi]